MATAHQEVASSTSRRWPRSEKWAGAGACRVVFDPRNRLVDGHLVCWAISAVLAEAQGRIGQSRRSTCCT